jgi:hypothetical protein
LKSHDVPEGYIATLRKLYDQQTASVQPDVESRTFSINRGVKQGDPISALLFIAVMETCFRSLKAKWKTANRRRKGRGFGFVIDDETDPLLNLRFADDVLLFAQSKVDAGRMIDHLGVEASKYGLKLHLGKTKIISLWADGKSVVAGVKVGDQIVEVLGPEGTEKYLGRKLCLGDFQATELKNRLASGWAVFMSYKNELCGKNYAFKDRARLFEAVVTPRVMYATATWTMTKDMEKELRTTRRKMLRMMIGTGRRRATAARQGVADEGANSLEDAANKSLHEGSFDPEPALEPWVDWIRRATHDSERLVKEVNLEDWVVIHRRRKWHFAGKAATKSDNRWSTRLFSWVPEGRRMLVDQQKDGRMTSFLLLARTGRNMLKTHLCGRFWNTRSFIARM